MNSDWPLRPIGELGNVVTGKTPSTDVRSNFGGPYPFITIPDLADLPFVRICARTLSEEGAQCLRYQRIPAGAVMMSCIATVGKCGITTRTSFTNQQINSVIFGKDVFPQFAYYAFRLLPAELEAVGGGGSVYTNVSKSRFASLSIPVPPLPEQRRIAAILGALDDKIDLNRRMNKTLEEMAQAIFKSWFIDFDGHADLVDSELGMIPSEWELGTLEDILVLQRGFDLPEKSRTPGRVRVLSAGGHHGTHCQARVRGPGVVTGRSGKLGEVFLVMEDFWPLNTTLWVKDYRRSGPFHAFHLLRTLDFARFNAGSAVPTLNRNHVHSLRLPVPSVEAVARFEATVAPLYQRHRMSQHESESLAALREALLPKLISGEIRVPETEVPG